MAVKFSQFNVGTTISDIDYIVGYKSTNNVQIPIGLVVPSVDGSGTANYITKWIDADTIGDSIIYDNGTFVGINTTSQTTNGEKLRIAGDLFINSLGSASVPSIAIGDTNSGIYASASGQISITTQGTQRLNIDGNGLGVSGDITVGNDIYIANGNFLKLQRTSGGLFLDTLGNESGTDDVRLLSSGNFKFVNGSLFELMRITSGGDISFRDTSNNEAFYWDASTSFLGIGTGSSPNARLNVKSTGSTAEQITLTHSGNAVNLVLIGQESGHGSLILMSNSGVNKVRLSAAGNNSYILDFL